MGVMVEPMSGIVSSRRALWMAWKRPCPASRCRDNIFEDHDGIVDNQTDGGGQGRPKSSD